MAPLLRPRLLHRGAERDLKKPDPARLENFLDHLPREVQHVFEFRDAAWYRDDVLDLLDRYGAAVCEHDLLPVQPPRMTGGFRYIRFHGATSKYAGLYGRAGLRPIARALKKWRDGGHTAWVYFNNDLHGHALLDAFDLSELIGEPVQVPEHVERTPAPT